MFWRRCFVLTIAISVTPSCTQTTENCGILMPPNNGVISSCTGSRVGSRCTARCNEGYRPEESIRFCSCIRGFCQWLGQNPSCEEVANCDPPSYEDGSITIVEEWPYGFAAMVELRNVLSLVSGWSIVVIFGDSLGKNARYSTWSAEVTAISPRHNAVTLSNLPFNRNYSTSTGKFHLLVVADGIIGKTPLKGYVGMYDHRVPNTVCLIPPRPLQAIQSPTTLLQAFQPLCESTSTPPTLTGIKTFTTTSSDDETIRNSILTTTRPTTETASTPFNVSNENIRTSGIDFTNVTNSIKSISPTSAMSSGLNATTSLATIPVETNTKHARRFLSEIDGMQCKNQQGESYWTQPGWTDTNMSYFSGNAIVDIPRIMSRWLVVIVFQQSISSLQVWNTAVVGTQANACLWKLGPLGYNRQIPAGTLDVNFIAVLKTHSDINPSGAVYLCSNFFATGDPVWLPDIALGDKEEAVEDANDETDNIQQSLISLSKAVTSHSTHLYRTTQPPRRIRLTSRPGNTARCAPGAPNGVRARRPSQTIPNWRRSRDGTKYDYNELLHKSILFYEAQRSGSLPPNYNRISWRGKSMLKDGCSIGVDLSGGWFDAGDLIKFTFPMAASVTNLAWGGIAFRHAYVYAGVLPRFLGSLKWPVKYLINAHTAPNELVGLVGDVSADHASWSRPEDWNSFRPVYKITQTSPGSDLAAETAAALASSSIVLKRTHSRIASAALSHAIELYEFAKKYRGSYHKSIPEVNNFYHSHSGYNDELIWAAGWLHKATNQRRYLDDAERLYDSIGGVYRTEEEFSWDNKLIGAQVLLANLTREEKYRGGVVRFMQKMLGNSVPKTSNQMLWIRKEGPCRYAANAALIALMAYELQPPLPERESYLQWARKQIHLLLGDAGRSYVVGVGKNYPKRIHHRSSSCPPPPATCDWTTFHSSEPNNFILYGALVGGPDRLGNYADDRLDYYQSEVAIDFNAGYQSAVAALKHHAVRNAYTRNRN